MRDGESSVLDNFRQGDVDAFETLFRLHQRAVYGWVLRIVRRPDAAEEVTVEAFWRIHKAHARFDPRRSFEAWARTIATHAALDWLRSHRLERDFRAEFVVEASAPATPDPAVAADLRNRIALAFSRLPPRLRVAALLAVVEELPHKEVAEALGISVTAVKLRVFRALRLLRRDLQQQGITP
jgi:RNA polymerase sigma-70 factor (ECF subfamily)